MLRRIAPRFGDRLAPLALVFLTALSVGCGDDGVAAGDDDDDLPPDGGQMDEPFTEATFQAFVTSSCSGAACHVGFAATPAAGMDLTDVTAATVNVPATETVDSTGLDRIEPGDHRASYLWHKVNGSHECPDRGSDVCAGLPAVEGTGGRMPLGGPFLPPSDVDRIADYIDGL